MEGWPRDILHMHMQALNTAGGKHFVGVNFGAMDKYRAPLTLEQWKHCVASLKALLAPMRTSHANCVFSCFHHQLHLRSARLGHSPCVHHLTQCRLHHRRWRQRRQIMGSCTAWKWSTATRPIF